MNTRHCCPMARRGGDPDRRSVSRWRRGGEIVGWIVPSATLVLLPKCPVCLMAYGALFGGVGISLASASHLRTSLVILCAVVLLWLAWRRFCWPALRPEPNARQFHEARCRRK